MPARVGFLKQHPRSRTRNSPTPTFTVPPVLSHHRLLRLFGWMLMYGLLSTGATVRLAAAEGAPGLPGSLVVPVDDVKMEFLLVPAGSFVMGSPDEAGDGDEFPAHSVTISQPFYLGRCEVTQEQWQAVMGNVPGRVKGPQYPVDTVSWKDCQRFLQKLGAKTGRSFALPTEAQWEYACRAGTTTRWSFGDDDASLDQYAWSEANSGGSSHQVGEKAPNPWGFSDMHGNVGEWCADRYAKHTYADGVSRDPIGPVLPLSDSRIWRGGAWGDHSDYLRCAYRNCLGEAEAHDGVGLRCVLLISNPTSFR